MIGTSTSTQAAIVIYHDDLKMYRVIFDDGRILHYHVLDHQEKEKEEKDRPNEEEPASDEATEEEEELYSR